MVFVRRIASLLVASALSFGFAMSPVSGQEPKRGGTLTFAVLGDPPTTDCHAATSFASMHYLSPHYSLLIVIDPRDTSKVAPDLAESWT